MIVIHAYGVPVPQGSKKGFLVKKLNRVVIVDDNKAKLKPWRQSVVDAALDAIAQQVALAHDEDTTEGAGRWQPLDAPLRVRMVFTMPKPSSARKTTRSYPDKKPDLSKLVRAVEDSLTDAGVWVDDSRVIECTARKVFPNEDPESLRSPGVLVLIERARSGEAFKAPPVKPPPPVDPLAGKAPF